jgi:hypothetical protein
MRALGIVLIVAGIIMMAITGFNFKTEKKVLDVGPLDVRKEESHHVGWPIWAGGIAVVAGVVLVVAGRRK